MSISPDSGYSIPILPRDFSVDMTVDIPFSTSVNESESGVSGRKSMRDVPLRKYTITINPDNAEEVIKIILAARGARWPVAIRDYAYNYQLTDETIAAVATTSPDRFTYPLTKAFTPATGGRSYSQRVLMIDETEETFVVKSDGTPTSYTVTDPGILNVPAGGVVTVTGQYLVPCVFVDDSLTCTIHVKELVSLHSVTLREITETELTALVGT